MRTYFSSGKPFSFAGFCALALAVRHRRQPATRHLPTPAPVAMAKRIILALFIPALSLLPFEYAAAQVADIPGDGTTTARLMVPGTLTGTIDDIDDQDAYLVALVAGATYQFDAVAAGSSTLDTSLGVYRPGHGNFVGVTTQSCHDSTGVLGGNDDIGGGSTDSQVTYTATQSGDHVLCVDAFAGTGNSLATSGAYRLTAADLTPRATISAPPDTSIPIAETALGGTTLTVTLENTEYEASPTAGQFTLNLSAGTGVTVGGVVRDSATAATLTLAYTDITGIDANIRIGVTVAAAAHTGSGDLTTDNMLRVAATAPSFAGMQPIANQVYLANSAITDLTLPAAGGGEGTLSYSLAPNPPNGLAFDADTRILSGTPDTEQAATGYTYTVTAGDGNTATRSFTIEILNLATGLTAVRELAATERRGRVRRIALTWLPPATVPVGTVSSYEIQGCSAADTDCVAFITSNHIGAADASQIATLFRATFNFYRVRARTAAGVSPWANVALTVDPGVVVDPGTLPSMVQNLMSSALADNSVTLTWEAPTDATSTAVNRYVVVRGFPAETATLGAFAPPGAEAVVTLATDVFTYADSGLLPGTEYLYEVFASSNAGDGEVAQLLATTTGALTTSIAGANTGAITEGSTDSITGTLTITTTSGNSEFVAPINSDGEEQLQFSAYGIFTISAAGVWTYSLNYTLPRVRALSAGESVQDTFTVTAAAPTADGVAVTQVVTITITGVNTRPNAAIQLVEGSTVAAGETLRLESDITDPDDDLGELTIAWTAAGGIGTFSAAASADTDWMVPDSTSPDEYLLTLTVTDPGGASDTEQVSITVTPPALDFGGATIDDQTYTMGAAITDLTLPAATGGTGPYSYALSGMPSGLAFDSGTRVLSGTPDAVQAATSYTYTATDAASPPATGTLAFTIEVAAPAPTVGGDLTGTATPLIIDAAGDTVSGGTASGTLVVSNVPSGVTPSHRIESDTTLGTLTVDSVTGAWSYQLDNSRPATRVFRPSQGTTDSGVIITTLGALEITSTVSITIGAGSFPDDPPTATAMVNGIDGGGTAGVSSTVTLSGAGSDPEGSAITGYAWAQTGGTTVVLAPDASTAEVTFTAPASPETLAFTLTVMTATQSSPALSVAVEITAAADLMPTFGIAAIDPQTYTVGTAVFTTLPIATSGDGALMYAITEALPDGLTFDDTSRALEGTPTTAQGVTTYTYTATDSDTTDPDTVELSFTIEIAAAALGFGGASIDDQTYTMGAGITDLTLPVASGGTGPYSYALSDMPSGLVFDSDTRVLSGTPDTAQVATSYTYTVTDSAVVPVEMSLTFTITVNAPSAALSFGGETITPQTYTMGAAITDLTLPAAIGGTGTLGYAITETLPTGLSFDGGTRVLSGTPDTAQAATTYTYTATDAATPPAMVTLEFTIEVALMATATISAPPDTSIPIAETALGGTTLTVTLESTEYEASPTAGQFTLNLIPVATGVTVGGVVRDSATAATLTLAYTGSTGINANTRIGVTVLDAAHTGSGDLTTDNMLRVAATAPSFAGMQPIANQAYLANSAITDLTLPAASGGEGTLSYSLAPNPPNGLAFDADTRVLSGTPDTPQAATGYTYTVTAGDGNTATRSFTIEILNPATGLTAVRDLVATERRGRVRRIALTWLPPATVPVGTVSSYEIQGCSAADTDCVAFITSNHIGAADASQSATLFRATFNFYRVRARTAAGVSPWANVALVEDPGLVVDPGTLPSMVQNLASSALADNSVTLTWEAPTDAVSTAVNRYVVVRGFPAETGMLGAFAPPGAEAVVTLATDVFTYTDSGLLPGTEYLYEVFASSNAGDGEVAQLLATTTGALTTSIAGENTGAITEGETDSITGTLTITTTSGNSEFVAPINSEGEEQLQFSTYGIFTISAAGVWTYSLNYTLPRVRALTEGESVQDTFTVTAAAPTADGVAVTQVVTITITGVNTRPNAAIRLVEGSTVVAGETLRLESDITDPDDDLSDLTIAWTAAGGIGTFSAAASADTDWMVPAATPPAEYLLTLTVTDPGGASDTEQVSITVTAAPLGFGTASVADQNYPLNIAITDLTLPVAVGGTGPYSYALSGMPSGLAFDGDIRVLSGAPDTVQAATSYTYTATDSASPPAMETLEFTIAVAAATATISATSPSPLTEADLNGATLTVTLAGSVTYEDTLPADSITLNADATTAGVTATAARVSDTQARLTLAFNRVTSDFDDNLDIIVTVLDAAHTGTGDLVTLPIVVEAVVESSDATLAGLTLSGGATLNETFAPGTLSYTADVASTVATIMVTPTATDAGATITVDSTAVTSGMASGAIDLNAGTNTITVVVTAGDGSTQTYTLTVTRAQPSAAPSFGVSAITPQTYTMGTPITDLTLPAATGGTGTLSYAITETLPTGLSFNAMTRVLSGTPDTAQVATTYTYTVTDSAVVPVEMSLTFTITVNAPSAALSFGGATIPPQTYTANTAITDLTLPAATGGTGTLSYAITETLPTGLSFNAMTRVLSGTPDTAQVATTYTYTATDAAPAAVMLELVITVNQPAAGGQREEARRQALEVTLGAFGRSFASGAVGVLDKHFASGAADSQLTLGGRTVSLESLTNGRAAANAGDVSHAGPNNKPVPASAGGHRMSGRELLSGSAFRLSLHGGNAAGVGATTLWARGATGDYEGEPENGFALDGDITSGYVGVDHRLDRRRLVGLAISHSESEVDFSNRNITDGKLETELTSILPYAHLQLRDNLYVWGVLGYGEGEFELIDGGERSKTDIQMQMAAVGARGGLWFGERTDVALKASAFVIEIDTSDEQDLASVTTDAQRLRVALQGSHHGVASSHGARFSRSLELGLRWDDGDAETGVGVDLGTGLEYVNPRAGVRLRLNGHYLLTHDESDLEEWELGVAVSIDPGERDRGVSFTLQPGWDSAGNRQRVVMDFTDTLGPAWRAGNLKLELYGERVEDHEFGLRGSVRY